MINNVPGLLISVAAFVVHFTFGFYRGRFKRFSRPWSRCLYIPIVINIVVRRFVLDWDWQTAMVYLWPATLIAHILGSFLGSRRKSVTDTKEGRMKFILILSGPLLFFAAPAFSELSVEDFEKIRTILKEEISEVETRLTKEISEVETRLTEKINKSEEHLKEYVTQEVGKVDIKIDEMDKRLTREINNMDKRLDQMFTLVVVLITTVIAVIGVPMTIILFQLSRQDKKQRSQDETIEALRQELEERNQGSIITP